MDEMGKTLLARCRGFWKMQQFSWLNFSYSWVDFKGMNFLGYRFRTISSLSFFRLRWLREEREETIHKRGLTILVMLCSGQLWYCKTRAKWTQSVPKGLSSSYLTACWSIWLPLIGASDCTPVQVVLRKLAVIVGKARTGFSGLWIT